eukprot:jgi/Pico_ML_1/56032/g1630.t1
MSAETKILKALLERNSREKDAYEDVFVQYHKLLEAWREIQAREAACSELDERQSEKLQAQKERDDLRSENQELVQRLLETSQNAAEKFNEAIRIHEEAVNMKIHYEMLLKAGSGIQNIKIKPEGLISIDKDGDLLFWQ